MTVQINTETCTGCEDCVNACPSGSMYMNNGKAAVRDDCSDCGACVAECKSGSLAL